MRRIAAAILLLVAAMSSQARAGTVTVSGSWGADGYALISFSHTGGVVDFNYTGGFSDSNLALFDAAGNHLISNDDTSLGGLFSRITQSLAAGNYTLLVTYCCGATGYAFDANATFASSDGYNDGSYAIGGDGTLAGMEAFIALITSIFAGDGELDARFQPYTVQITSDTNVTISDITPPIPEPATLALLGTGLLTLAAARRRRAG